MNSQVSDAYWLYSPEALMLQVDGGIILETDSQSISNRVMMRGVEGTQPITDMSMSQAIASAKDQLFKS